MRSIEVRQGQSLFDVAVQEYGDAAIAIQIAIANDICVSATPPCRVCLPDGIEVDLPVLQRIASSGCVPASDISGADMGGIGAMGVEIDFCVYD
ncbi:MAG: hypothetical protein RR706_09650 [Muribaculaceae bacterium]